MIDKRPPLYGRRVISMAEQYPGPYATLLLADWGADVVLVERLDGGDPSRQFPHFFDALNRNKRSVALNLKSPEGKRALHRLVGSADAFIEGFSPGVAGRLGADYESLCEHNSKLVYVSMTGFGQDGPYRDWVGHDISYQALAGLLHARNGIAEPSMIPDPTPYADLCAGMFGAMAVLLGLERATQSRTSTYVDVAMLDGLISWMTTQLVPIANDTGPPGIEREPGYRLYRCSDDSLISLSVAHEDNFWSGLCRALQLSGSTAELSSEERLKGRDQLEGMLQRQILHLKRDELIERLVSNRVPFGPVHSLEDVLGDSNTHARGMMTPVIHRDGTTVNYVRQPLTFREFEAAPTVGPPKLGADTGSLLVELGYTTEEVSRLARDGVICQDRMFEFETSD